MKKKLIKIMVLYFMVLLIISAYFLNFKEVKDISNEKGKITIDINEIRKESELIGIKDKEFYNKLDNLESTVVNNVTEPQKNNFIMYIVIVFSLLIVTLFVYIYYAVLRPFERMDHFAGEIAKGNLNLDLKYERNNLFGDFTWAFDRMRREIIKARNCEKAAIENNKTVIATLSHDIKTPIASIKAYTEGLEANLATNAAKRQNYINIILKKCDEVTTLTNDIFLHSLADLGKLKMNQIEVSIGTILREYLDELLYKKDNISINYDFPEAKLLIDTNRFKQVLENIINNSLKYAKGALIEIKAEINLNNYIITIRDYGNGIADEDMPFIFEKFYRGKNAAQEQGAGLGLYIVKYIMRQLKGDIEIKSFHDGLEAKLILPVIDKIS